MLDELRTRLAEPSARGLAGAVSRAVRDGALRPGDRLPPIRTVARALDLSPTTVSAAWSLLARSGTIRTDGRRGTTVADRRRPGSPRYRQALDHAVPLRLELSTGVPDPELLPDLAAALQRTAVPAAPASYLDAPVVAELAELLRADWPYPVDDLAVVDGAMDGLDLVTRALLDPGERVAVESPGFPPLLDLLEASGAEVVGIPVDADGLSVEALRASGRVGAIYLQPRAQNPTGVSLSDARAEQLAELAQQWQATVVEDDSAGAVAASDPVSVGRHAPHHTVHVRSFAKSHGPDLRLAALSAPPELAARVQGLRQLGQGWTSRLLQRVLHTLLTDPDAVATVAHARDVYRERRTLLVEALAEHGIETGGSDGLNVWVPVADETSALARLAGRGIGVAPGAPFAARPDQQPHVRVTAGLVRDGHGELAAALADAARDAVRIPV